MSTIGHTYVSIIHHSGMSLGSNTIWRGPAGMSSIDHKMLMKKLVSKRVVKKPGWYIVATPTEDNMCAHVYTVDKDMAVHNALTITTPNMTTWPPKSK